MKRALTAALLTAGLLVPVTTLLPSPASATTGCASGGAQSIYNNDSFSTDIYLNGADWPTAQWIGDNNQNGMDLTATAGGPGSYEKYDWCLDPNGTLSLYSTINGLWVGVNNQKADYLTATAGGPGGSEQFEILCLTGGAEQWYWFVNSNPTSGQGLNEVFLSANFAYQAMTIQPADSFCVGHPNTVFG